MLVFNRPLITYHILLLTNYSITLSLKAYCLWKKFSVFAFTSSSLHASDLSRYEIKSLPRHKITEVQNLAETPKLIDEVIQQNTPISAVLEIDKNWSNNFIDSPEKIAMVSSEIGAFLKTWLTSTTLFTVRFF